MKHDPYFRLTVALQPIVCKIFIYFFFIIKTFVHYMCHKPYEVTLDSAKEFSLMVPLSTWDQGVLAIVTIIFSYLYHFSNLYISFVHPEIVIYENNTTLAIL